MNRKNIYFIAVTLFVILFFMFYPLDKGEGTVLKVKVQKGDFEVLVYTTGQLEAEKSEFINAPTELAGPLVWIPQIKINDMVEEGTFVDSGQVVANLDFSTVEEELKKAQDDLDQKQSDMEDARLDSSLTLSNLRDQIINALEDQEEKKIVLDQSAFESPSVIRKAKMDVEKSKRNYEQEIHNYSLKKEQSKAKIERSMLRVKQAREKVEAYEKLFDKLSIRAPKKGMVIYAKDHRGNKIQAGATISPWRPAIATLPDLSTLCSKTFVNEIDISKIKKGQKVKLGVDAFPEKQFEGEVINVANIGQPLPKTDAKVFEVNVKVWGYDKELKPAMTTSNVIHAEKLTEVNFIPLEAVFETDSMKYVYVDRRNIEKQIVDLGFENENFVVVNRGLEDNETIILNTPSDDEKIEFSGWEIYEEQKLEAERKKKEQEKIRKEQELEQERENQKNETHAPRNGKGKRKNNKKK